MLQEPMELPIGTIIRGTNGTQYIVESLLGRGGFSAVYRVYDRRAREKVFALKEILNARDQKQGQLANEAELLKRLEHHALPHVYQTFEDAKNDRIYIIMDYIKGKDLEALRLAQTEQRFSVALALALLTPIVEAVSYLHKQNPPVVHRDIKPSNIIVPIGSGNPYLVDFGLAKEYIADRTTNAIRYGTPGYAAPEQYGQGTTPRTDIYALGATFYTLLTGQVPIDALTRSVDREFGEPLVPAHKLCPTVPMTVAWIIARAMHLRSEERFGSVDEFWETLSLAVIRNEASDFIPPAHTPLPITVTTQDIAENEPAKLRQPSGRARSRNSVFIQLPTSLKQLKKAISFLIVLILICFIVDGTLVAIYWSRHSQHQPPTVQTRALTIISTPTPTPTPTSPYAHLATTYGGTINDSSVAKEHTSLYLRHVQQSQDRLSGDFEGLNMQGTFTGNFVDSVKIHLIVTLKDKSEQIVLDGEVKFAGDIVGQFSVVNQDGQSVGEYGDWNLQSLTVGKR